MEQVTNSIYYHCFCVNDFYARFIKTYSKIIKSGLLLHIDKINVVCVGDSRNYFNNLEKIKVINCASLCSTEAATLNYIKDTSTTNNVLYIHSKGVTRGYNPNINNWIDYMEYFCIEKYKDRLYDLKDNDVTGVNLQTFNNKLHYSGNFWWATTNHIKSLTYCNEQNRHEAEMWICSIPNKKYKCVHKSNVDHYVQQYVRENYTKELPII